MGLLRTVKLAFNEKKEYNKAMQTKATLLTIGTEITAGEIVNSNAAWLSLRLEESGARVHAHITVRDQRDEILNALKWIHENSSHSNEPHIVIVTGGLGPTSDDMTRECLAHFTKNSLNFDAAAWSELQALLHKKGVQVRETHKHQCHFPAGSEKLINPVGTAHGFYLKKDATHFFALPGPPRELEPMWVNLVAPKLQKIIPAQSYRWVRWTCVGVPESQVAEAVENIIAGTNIEVGYRAKPPNIFLKIYAHPDRDAEIIKKIDATVAPWAKAPEVMKFD